MPTSNERKMLSSNEALKELNNTGPTSRVCFVAGVNPVLKSQA